LSLEVRDATQDQSQKPAMSIIRPCRAEDRDAMLAIINAAAEAYRGVIPADCWHVPYMPSDELNSEIAAGITFWGYVVDGAATVQPEQPERKDVRDEAPLSPAPPTGTDDGLILRGCLRAFDRQGLLGHDPGVIVRGMPVDAAKDVHRLAPTVASWLNRIKGPASPIGADEPQFPRRSEPGTILKKT
jgi:hypothetical protein